MFQAHHPATILALCLAFSGLVSQSVAQTPAQPAQASTPEKLPLWPKNQAPDGQGNVTAASPSITVHLPAAPADGPTGATAVVICPGGGYGGLVTGGEGHGIAAWLTKNGMAGMVLEYRLPAGNHALPLLDAQQAIRLVRANASKWKVNPAKVGIMGFSAGGHLAASAATLAEKEKPGDRPDFAILVYPVISMGKLGHGGSRKNLLGSDPSEALVNRYSTELQVSRTTPPCFLTHAVNDKVVSIDHSRLFHAALKEKGVKAELLELPSGDHGLNGYKGPMWDAWQAAAIPWLRGL